MNGLRIYVSEKVKEASTGYRIFYSRRSLGPYYKWCYEEKLEQWRVSRMHPFDFSPKELCASQWRTIPSLLQRRLKLHYDE
jgi:hypothetical protein